MESWIKFVIKYRKAVMFLSVLVTLGLMTQLRELKIVLDTDDVLPQNHPYVATNNLIEKVFGNKYSAIIGITAKDGTVYDEKILGKVKRITDKITEAPGVVKNNINSLASRKTKAITGNEEGMIVQQIMESEPKSPEDVEKIKEAVATNPVFNDLLVSADQKTTSIVAEFTKIPGGYTPINDYINNIIAPEKDGTVDFATGGIVVFLANLEMFSSRMGLFFLIALVIIGIIHYEAFRTVQALILPLVTAILAVIWALGVLALLGQSMDVFNASTPIMILAIAAGHAVQILKRYYEEFAKLKTNNPNMSPKEMNEEAVRIALSKVGNVMVAACTVAALGFLSLVIFDIKSIRTFGLFSAAGVAAALVLELTFIPALRCILPPPGKKEFEREKQHTVWDSLIEKLFYLVSHKRKQIYAVASLLVVGLSLGGYFLVVNNSGKENFSKNVQFRLDDDKLNERMAGTNILQFVIDAGDVDGIKNPEVLKGMEKIQEFLKKDEIVGKTVSFVDFMKQMNKSMHADDPAMYRVPESSDLVAQYLFLYSSSGEPGDFDNFVDNDYQKALISVFMKKDDSTLVDALAKKTLAYAKEVLPSTVKVDIGGGTASGVAQNEIIVREKILNILQIMGAVFLVSSIVFRSFAAGIFILIPLIAAVFVNFGIMGLTGIPLMTSTALVSAMAVGIGADYGIYMSYRMKEELKNYDDENVAIEKSFKSAGKAAIFVSTAVAGGFGVLMFSFGFTMHIWMGFLIALAMLVSSFSALTVFPALILSLRPKYIFDSKKGK
jgi:predicted RND superfamily exporter protein